MTDCGNSGEDCVKDNEATCRAGHYRTTNEGSCTHTGGILTIAAIATLDGETRVMGLFIGALLSHLVSSGLAGLTYRKPSVYYRCAPIM